MKHELPDGILLHYELHGNADAPVTLVFLNGLSQATVAWSAVAPAFASDYRIVLLDLVFQGQSGKAAEFRTYDGHAADVEHLLETLGLENIVLCGISYGSAVAQHILVNHPGRYKGAVLLSTFGHNTPIFLSFGHSWASALRTGGYPLMLDVMLPVVLGENYFEKPLIPIETLKETKIGSAPEAESLLHLLRGTEARGDYRSKLPAIKAPVLVAHGELDILIPAKVAQEVADLIPGAGFEVIPGVGHTLNLEAIPQTIGVLRSFLAALE